MVELIGAALVVVAGATGVVPPPFAALGGTTAVAVDEEGIGIAAIEFGIGAAAGEAPVVDVLSDIEAGVAADATPAGAAAGAAPFGIGLLARTGAVLFAGAAGPRMATIPITMATTITTTPAIAAIKTV